MFERIADSFRLMKASWHVLMMDKELLVFPVMSSLAAIFITATFIAPLFLTGGLEAAAGLEPGPITVGVGALYYVVMYTATFFFNAALVGAALIRLDGGDPTVGDGLAIASKRMGAIIGYAMIAATVGIVLRAIEERVGALGRLIASFLGVAWTLVTFLTVPVLVTKDVGPVDAVRESAAIFKRTWGENVVGIYGMGFAITLLLFSWTITVVIAAWLASTISPVAVAPFVIVGVAGAILISLGASALQGIYTAALYRYAMTGDVPDFDTDILGNAFRAK